MLSWKPWGKYAIITDKYSIAKTFHNTVATYTVWELPSTMLGSYTTLAEAKQACQDLVATC